MSELKTVRFETKHELASPRTVPRKDKLAAVIMQEFDQVFF